MFKAIIKKLVPDFIVRYYHFKIAFLGALRYGFPSRKLKVIGVTGTNGKSTTVLMIARILEEAGFKVGSVSSMWYKIAGTEKPNPWHMTMPGRFILQKLLRQMVRAGCQYAVIEATSEGVLQSRHKFINFQTMVLTNLSEEHIERHGSLGKYREAKGKLFQATKKNHILNTDDKNLDYFLQFKSNKKYLFSANPINYGQNSHGYAGILLHSNRPGYPSDMEANIRENDRKNVEEGIGGNVVENITESIVAGNIGEKDGQLRFAIRSMPFVLPLMGKFNVYNALSAVAVAKSENISLEVCRRALAKIKQVPGRMEEVISEPFKVIIDLAHTIPAVEQVYQTAKKMVGERGKIISVFGSAGGGRDKWKRPKLGELAGKYCDVVILTNEDPYDENSEQIINQIKEGVQLLPPEARKELNSFQFQVFKILDRQKAIRKALELAKPGDVVLLLGKGTEATMVFANGEKIPWDEQAVVKEEFQKLALHF